MIDDEVRIKAVILDLDDTLISEGEYIKSGYRHIAGLLSKRIGEEVDPIFNMLMDLFRENPRNVFNRLLDKLKFVFTEDDIIEYVEAYRNHLPDIHFYPDVLPCLKQLKVKGIKTGIITDGYISTQRNKLKVLRAEIFFDHIIVTDEIGREYWKPNPRAFEMMKDKLGVQFEEMLYVGDNPQKDFYISTIHPIRTVRIIRETGIYDGRPYLDAIKENYTIRSLAELIYIYRGV